MDDANADDLESSSGWYDCFRSQATEEEEEKPEKENVEERRRRNNKH